MINIEITGCNPKNMGDILMLEASIREITQRIPPSNFSVRRHSLTKLVSNDISLHFLPLLRLGSNRHHLKNSLNNRIFSPLSKILSPLTGHIDASNVKVLIDVCGYKYGGPWGESAINTDLRRYKEFKKNGGKVILLPKTYGPFTNTIQKNKMRELALTVDLCLVRDNISKNNLVNIGVPEEICPVFPDYTTTVPGNIPTEFSKLEKFAVIIPNYRMIDTNKDLSENRYLEILTSLTKKTYQLNLNPFIIVHDRGNDKIIAEHLSNITGAKLIQNIKATEIKGIIGKSSLVYSDRLHGLINALSQGIPSLTSGWSYKYSEITKSYNTISSHVPHNQRTPNEISLKWEELWRTKHQKEGALLHAAHNITLRNTEMWDLVTKTIKN